MSLSSHLDKRSQSPVRAFLCERFPDTREMMADCRASLKGVETIRPAVKGSARPPFHTLGTAVDYRLRYYFEVTPPREFVAATGALLLNMPERLQQCFGYDTPIERALRPELVEEFFGHVEQIVDGACPVGQRIDRPHEEALAACCYVLALFEEIRRAGTSIHSPLFMLRYEATLTDLLKLAHPSSVDDLCEQSWAFHDSCAAMLSLPATLNPTFDGSPDIGGADGDLIVDGCLIEIKASTNPIRAVREGLRQLLGYVLLDYSDRHRIRDVGFYLARQGLLLEWPLDCLLGTISCGEAAPLPELRKEFRAVVNSARAERLAA